MRTFLRRRSRLATFLAALVIVTVGTTGIALATTGVGISTTQIAMGHFDSIHLKAEDGAFKVKLDTKGESDVYVVSNVIQPGGNTGWHTHPGPSLITVKSGTITAYEGDDPTCTPTVYTAGQGFVDPGGEHVHILRNDGTVPAETIAVQIVARGAARRIDMPAPGNCPF